MLVLLWWSGRTGRICIKLKINLTGITTGCGESQQVFFSVNSKWVVNTIKKKMMIISLFLQHNEKYSRTRIISRDKIIQSVEVEETEGGSESNQKKRKRLSSRSSYNIETRPLMLYISFSWHWGRKKNKSFVVISDHPIGRRDTYQPLSYNKTLGRKRFSYFRERRWKSLWACHWTMRSQTFDVHHQYKRIFLSARTVLKRHRSSDVAGCCITLA